MALDLKDIPAKFGSTLARLRRYRLLIIVVVVLASYGFLVFQINRLSSVEPTEDEVTEQLQSLNRPKIDQAAVDKIEELEDQNIQVQTLFDQARDNPFE